jgi:hypothetical protein
MSSEKSIHSGSYTSDDAATGGRAAHLFVVCGTCNIEHVQEPPLFGMQAVGSIGQRPFFLCGSRDGGVWSVVGSTTGRLAKRSGPL